jgi:hypothetical protein
MAQDTFNKFKLSGSTDGKDIKVAATGSPGTTIHTADATKLDEIWLYAYNSSGAAVLLTIQFGGTTSPDDDIKVNVPSQSGLMLVVPGLTLTNSDVVKAYAGTTNVITIGGFVNRITAG